MSSKDSNGSRLVNHIHSPVQRQHQAGMNFRKNIYSSSIDDKMI